MERSALFSRAGLFHFQMTIAPVYLRNMASWLKWMIASIVLLLIAGGGCVYLLVSADPETKYVSYEEALNDESNGIPKGWIPRQLPRSAYEIAETHDPSSPERAEGKFSYKEGDSTGVFSDCLRLGERGKDLSSMKVPAYFFCDASEFNSSWCIKVDLENHSGKFYVGATPEDCEKR